MYHKDNHGISGSEFVYFINQYIFKDTVIAVQAQSAKLIFKGMVLFTYRELNITFPS